MYDAFLNPYIPLQGYPGMQGGVGALGPVGAAVKLNFVLNLVQSRVGLFIFWFDFLYICVFSKRLG